MEASLLAQARARVGTVLRDKYSIERILGVGGMAVVYVATHRNRQSFAIKMLHPVLSLNPAIRARFLGEGYRANSVRHRGAVKVLDDDVAEDGSVFLVMELLDGESLDRTAERFAGRLPARAVLAIGHQLMDVLAAAHVANVVHRDIKPANLFLTREGTLKVLDFGIARLLETAGSQVTHTGAVLGTPAFMAPEQARGMLDDIDGQTDIWAAGATLFYLLTGCLVHEGENAQMLLVHAATRPAPSLETRAPQAPPGLIAVIDQALAFDKAARWPSAEHMRDAIRDTYVLEAGEDLSPAPLLALFGSSSPSASTTIPVRRSVPLPEDSRPPIGGAGGLRDSRRTPAPPAAQGAVAGSQARSRSGMVLALVVAALGAAAWLLLGSGLRPSRQAPNRALAVPVTEGAPKSPAPAGGLSPDRGPAGTSLPLPTPRTPVPPGPGVVNSTDGGSGSMKSHSRRHASRREGGPSLDPSTNSNPVNPLDMPLQ